MSTLSQEPTNVHIIIFELKKRDIKLTKKYILIEWNILPFYSHQN